MASGTNPILNMDRYVYTAYGRATLQNEDWSNSPSLPYTDGPLYAGYFYDASTGLYHTATRDYDPSLSAWLTRDPIGYAGGINLYEYCGGNPTNATDPSGLQGIGTWGVDRARAQFPDLSAHQVRALEIASDILRLREAHGVLSLRAKAIDAYLADYFMASPVESILYAGVASQRRERADIGVEMFWLGNGIEVLTKQFNEAGYGSLTFPHVYHENYPYWQDQGLEGACSMLLAFYPAVGPEATGDEALIIDAAFLAGGLLRRTQPSSRPSKHGSDGRGPHARHWVSVV